MKLIGMWLGGLLLIVGLLYLFPWGFTWNQARTVTVVGEASNQEANQVATFTAGVNAVNDSRDVAIKEVNDKIAVMTESVKKFGIEPNDLKTQSTNIYQNMDTYYDEGGQRQRLGQWNVSNTLEIRLRDVARGSELAELLSGSGANNVWGPNYALDGTSAAEDALMEQAIEHAREKALRLAAASGADLGKVVSVVEGVAGGYVTPFNRSSMDGMGGGGYPMESGSTTVTKTVTVTFELK